MAVAVVTKVAVVTAVASEETMIEEKLLLTDIAQVAKLENSFLGDVTNHWIEITDEQLGKDVWMDGWMDGWICW